MTDAARDALGQTLARVARLGQGYELQIDPPGDEWLPAADVIAGGAAFEAARTRLGAASADPTSRRAIGSQFVVAYLRFIWPAVAAFALERRVPDVGPDNLLVRFDEAGWPAAAGLRHARFGALEVDRAGPDAAFRAGNDAILLEWLHRRVVDDHAALLIETVQARFQTSGSALWGNLAGAFAVPLLWHVQHVVPDGRGVVRDAQALLGRDPSSPAHDKVQLVTVAHHDGDLTVHARRTCCLRWAMPAGNRCEECPLTRGPDAAAFMRARVAEAVQRGQALRAALAPDPALAVLAPVLAPAVPGPER